MKSQQDPLSLVLLLVFFIITFTIVTGVLSGFFQQLNQDKYQAGKTECENKLNPLIQNCENNLTLYKNTLINSSHALDACTKLNENLQSNLTSCIVSKTLELNQTEIKEIEKEAEDSFKEETSKTLIVLIPTIIVSSFLVLNFIFRIELVIKFIAKISFVGRLSPRKRQIILAAITVSLTLALSITLLTIFLSFRLPI